MEVEVEQMSARGRFFLFLHDRPWSILTKEFLKASTVLHITSNSSHQLPLVFKSSFKFFKFEHCFRV